MDAFYSPLRLALPIALLSILQFPAIGLAQQPDVNGNPYETEERITGCTQLAALPPLPSAKVVSCRKGDSVQVSMPLQPDANGYAQEKRVRGAYEFREYRIKKEQDFTFDNLLDILPMASFTVKYSIRPATITARNGDTWILINISDGFYDVSVVHEAQVSCAPPKDADEISHEMQVHNRIAIYGLQFSPENHIILEKNSEILAALLKYLKQNSDLPVFIESHKFTTDGTEDNDFEITRERANAVVDWLVANGIRAARLQAKPFGRMKPLTGKSALLDIQCSERIEISKGTK
jgi:outer membrane protein OmpA-like peptidoglycan-associated protein